MPFYVRRLPGEIKELVDSSSLKENEAIYNPSYAAPIIYLRVTHYLPKHELNYTLLYNTETKTQTVIRTPENMLAPTVNLFVGLEDLRLCWFQGKLWFAATSTHATNRMLSEMLVGYFDKTLTSYERMVHVDVGIVPAKNICPFVWQNELHFLDTYERKLHKLVEITDAVTGEWRGYRMEVVKRFQVASGVLTEPMRGSTSPIHLHGNTWGCVVHDIIYNDNEKLALRLSYLHHWMEFDIETGMITYMSTSFWLARWGIEFVSGIHKDTVTGEIHLYFGVADRVPMMIKTTLHDLRIGK